MGLRGICVHHVHKFAEDTLPYLWEVPLYFLNPIKKFSTHLEGDWWSHTKILAKIIGKFLGSPGVYWNCAPFSHIYGGFHHEFNEQTLP